MTQQIVIYAARDLQQAHMLKNELQRYGIRAWVTNETLSRGFGVECPSWGTLPRVIVEEKNAVVARQIALSHDKTGAHEVESQLPDPAHFKHDPEAWPRCPKCGAPRPTKCPICKTTGTDFPETDPEFAWGFGLEEVHDATESGAGCTSCGPGGGCASPASGGDLPDEDASPSDEGDAEDQERPFVLRCTICDEPFSPEFPNQCTWCGEEFDDGYDVDLMHELPPQDSPIRIIFTIIGLMLVGLLLIWILVY